MSDKQLDIKTEVYFTFLEVEMSLEIRLHQCVHFLQRNSLEFPHLNFVYLCLEAQFQVGNAQHSSVHSAQRNVKESFDSNRHKLYGEKSFNIILGKKRANKKRK